MNQWEQLERRKLLADGVAFAIAAYLKTGSILNPNSLASTALGRETGPTHQGEKQRENLELQPELVALAHHIQGIRAAFDEGKLIVFIDRPTILGLIERMLKMSFARQDSAAAAQFEVEAKPVADDDHDGALVLPNRSIFIKLIPEGQDTVDIATRYLRRAVDANPSEYWLFAVNEGDLDIPFEPVFTAGRILRGRLKVVDACSVIEEIVGEGHRVIGERDVDGGLRFTISKQAVTQER